MSKRRKKTGEKENHRQTARRMFIVLPIYNEAENIIPLAESLKRVLSSAEVPYLVLAVNDGSTDQSKHVLKQLARAIPLKYLENPVNSGLGVTLRKGLMEAIKLGKADDVVVTMDADNTHDPVYVPRLFAEILDGADIAIASRFIKGGEVEGVPWQRRLLSQGARLFFSVFDPVKGVADYSGGFRAYRLNVLKQGFARFGDGFITEQGFACMAEILLKLKESVIREVPYTLRYSQKKGASKIKIVRTILRYLLMTVTVKRQLKRVEDDGS